MARTALECVIPNGGTDSNEIPVNEASFITIQAPASLTAVTYTIMVSDRIGGTYATLNDGTSDIKVPAAAKAIAYPMPFNVKTMKIHAASAVGSAHTFKIYMEEDC